MNPASLCVFCMRLRRAFLYGDFKMKNIDKPWLCIEKQLGLLHSRGVKISNIDKALSFLLENNYFRISGFTLCHRRNDVFQPNFSTDNMEEICKFDSELRMLIMGLLGYVEITYKSLIAYYHTKKYGPMGYECSATFDDITTYATIMCKIIRLKKHYEKCPEIFLKHYVIDKNGRLPFWAAIELLNFTDTSKLFRALHTEMKKEIVKDYLGYTFGTAIDYVENWLWCASVLRNIVAHRGRLYNRLLQVKPKLTPKDQKRLRINSKTGKPMLNKLFAYLIVIKKLYPKNDVWKDFAYDVSELTWRFPFIQLKEYGFPDNWRKELES